VLETGREVSYDIVGDGPLRSELERLIEQLGITTRVRLAGWKNHGETIAMMEASHVLLAPSVTASDGDEEGIPNVIKEAMAMGLPVISTLHAGIPELVTDGESGFLVPERGDDVLAERIIYLYDHPDIWPRISHAARRKVETRFDIGRLSKDLVALYATSIKQQYDHAPAVGGATPLTVDAAATTDEKNVHPLQSGRRTPGN
jgi:colanic acid/amylovoran biosynthesis glycosyltransferase